MLQKYIGWFCFLSLVGVAVVHAYWALGGLWPAQTEADLVSTVIGAHSPHMPPDSLILLIAVLIFTAGCFTFAAGVMGLKSGLFIQLPLTGLAFIFLIRGAVTYFPFGPFNSAAEPFASLNALYFSPLILVLAAGFAFLAWAQRN